MTSKGRRQRATRAAQAGAIAAALLIGCSQGRDEPVAQRPDWAPKTIAVAPAINASGSRDFDPVRLGDLAASELGSIAGVHVIGVNRVLAALANRQKEAIRSPADAIQVVSDLGADGIVVFAITEYDPYDPPVVGLVVQLYAPADPFRPPDLDPVAESRLAAPIAASESTPDSGLPWAQVQRVFNASHDTVVADVKRYAKKRDAGTGPYGWRKYLVSQEHFVRYCLHTALSELLSLPAVDGEPSTG